MTDELQRILSFKPSSSASDGDKNKQPRSKVPVVLGHNTTYIVCGMVIKDDQVLMIQEAIPSCKGSWYLPAGIVERNESLEEAAKREFNEESGYEFSPKALIKVEFQSFRWVRFTFIGDIVGGKMKTPAEADEESIQAQWMPADTTKLRATQKLRALDCLALIDAAYKWNKENEEEKYNQLIVRVPHVTSSVKVLLIRQDGDKIYVLQRQSPSGDRIIPSCDLESGRDQMVLIEKALLLAGFMKQYVIHGILSVEHEVQGGDGICVTMVTTTTCSELKADSGYTWSHVTDAGMAKQLENYMTKKNLLIDIFDY